VLSMPVMLPMDMYQLCYMHLAVTAALQHGKYAQVTG